MGTSIFKNWLPTAAIAVQVPGSRLDLTPWMVPRPCPAYGHTSYYLYGQWLIAVEVIKRKLVAFPKCYFLFPFGCRYLAFDYKKIVDLVDGRLSFVYCLCDNNVHFTLIQMTLLKTLATQTLECKEAKFP
jgi:hypothetical protein